MIQCHKCQNKDCLNCPNKKEEYSYRYSHYFIDGFDPVQPSTSGSEQVTNFPDEVEDRLRKFMYQLFDLSPLELLMLKGIMNGNTLEQFSDEMTKLLKSQTEMMGKNAERKFTRHHAFQLRKSMLKKLGDRFYAALLTRGQRKKLKLNPPLDSRSKKRLQD